MKIKQFTNLFQTSKQVSIKSFSTNLFIRGDLNKPKEALPQENRDSVEKSNAKGSSKQSTNTSNTDKGATENSKRTSTGSSISSNQESKSGAFPDEMKKEYNKMMNKNEKDAKDDDNLSRASPLQDDLQTQPSQNDKDQSAAHSRTINDVRNEQIAEHNK